MTSLPDAAPDSTSTHDESPGTSPAGSDVGAPQPEWWRYGVVYEVYPRSFADGNGDGEGDLLGIRNHLGYLADLGVDGVWIAPFYPSPMADGGYDVADFRDIHPMYGTIADADDLIAEAQRLGLKVVIDIVANHTSNEHAWFTAALAAAPGSPERDRYFFRDGSGPDGSEPPNNWISCFGGAGWTRITEADGSPGQWYLHSFAPEQPDLNWRNEDVLSDFDDILRFWLDKGVDGLRIDAAPALAKDPSFRDADYGGDLRFLTLQWENNPHWDVDDVHSIFRRWRSIGDSYEGDRVFVAEAVVNSSEQLAKYLRSDEMQTAFNFQYMKSAWEATPLREAIDATLLALEPVGAPATWVLASHDEVRLVTRYGRATTGSAHLADGQGEIADIELGTRRARAASMLALALPGGAYIYQGEELGLPHVDDLPDEVLQDPMFFRTNGETRGRDGCRVPIPWSGTQAPYGFSPDGVTTWLPQPDDWAALTVEAQAADPDSTLALHRQALHVRRELADLHTPALTWLPSPAGTLHFRRGDAFECFVNISPDSVAFPGGEVLLASSPLDGSEVPSDTAVWLVHGAPDSTLGD